MPEEGKEVGEEKKPNVLEEEELDEFTEKFEELLDEYDLKHSYSLTLFDEDSGSSIFRNVSCSQLKTISKNLDKMFFRSGIKRGQELAQELKNLKEDFEELKKWHEDFEELKKLNEELEGIIKMKEGE